jgi:hypothetical protein
VAPLLLKCDPRLSFKPSKCLKRKNFGMERLLNRKRLEIFPKCGPQTVFQSLNVIVRPVHGFEFDMPAFNCSIFNNSISQHSFFNISIFQPFAFNLFTIDFSTIFSDQFPRSCCNTISYRPLVVDRLLLCVL